MSFWWISMKFSGQVGWYPSQTHLNLKSRKISLVNKIPFPVQNIKNMCKLLSDYVVYGGYRLWLDNDIIKDVSLD